MNKKYISAIIISIFSLCNFAWGMEQETQTIKSVDRNITIYTEYDLGNNNKFVFDLSKESYQLTSGKSYPPHSIIRLSMDSGRDVDLLHSNISIGDCQKHAFNLSYCEPVQNRQRLLSSEDLTNTPLKFAQGPKGGSILPSIWYSFSALVYCKLSLKDKDSYTILTGHLNNSKEQESTLFSNAEETLISTVGDEVNNAAENMSNVIWDTINKKSDTKITEFTPEENNTIITALTVVRNSTVQKTNTVAYGHLPWRQKFEGFIREQSRTKLFMYTALSFGTLFSTYHLYNKNL